MNRGRDVWRRGDPRRRFLLETYRVIAAATTTQQTRLLSECAAQFDMVTYCHPGTIDEDPGRAAVRIVHALELSARGVHFWRAAWSGDDAQQPAEQLALASALLLSHRDELLLLVGRLAGAMPADEQFGALVDAETCGRIAVAGYDSETELRLGNQSRMLEAAGDLLYGLPELPVGNRGQDSDGVPYVLLGLKLPCDCC